MKNVLSDLEFMIMLASLRLGEDAYGVPIAHEIKRHSGREFPLPSIYSVLERLEKRALISSEIGKPTPERGGRAKRYIRLTPKGIKAIRETRTGLMRLWRNLPQLQEGK